MTQAIITTDFNKGQYVKSDRSGKTDYPVCLKSEKDGKLYWVKTCDILNVVLNSGKISGEKFFSLLSINY